MSEDVIGTYFVTQSPMTITVPEWQQSYKLQMVIGPYEKNQIKKNLI